MKNVFKSPNSSFIPNILQQEAELLRIAGLSDTEKLHYLEDAVTRLVDQASVIQKALDEAKHLQLLNWLSSSRFTRHHQALSEKRMPHSATWVLSHSKYRSWKNSSSSSIILLHGIPGSGKSNICSAVVDSFLNERASNKLAAPVAYYYCHDCEYEPYRAQPTEVLRSILRQLTISHDGPPAVRDNIIFEFDRRVAQSNIDGMGLLELTAEDCIKLILEVTSSDPVTIAVDALDTLDEQNCSTLIKALIRIVNESPNIVKVFLTSRNDSHIFALLPNEESATHSQPASTTEGLKVDVKRLAINRDDTLQDVKLYVELRLAQAVDGRHLLRKDPSPELRGLLAESLINGAAEMFQWVNVQIEYLCLLNREEDIRIALQNGTMATLDATYALVLERILTRRDTSRNISIRAFSWLLYMREAVPPEAFLAAVFKEASDTSQNSTRQDLEMICSSLVLLDSKCNTFRFSHQ